MILSALLTAASLVLILSSCDRGLEIVRREVAQLPYRTVYVAGVDDSLDMSGCVIFLHLRDGRMSEVVFEESQWATVKHEIDFSTPGEYEVFFYWGDIQFDTIIIQVVPTS